MNKLRNNVFFDNIPVFLQPLFTKCDFPWQIVPLIKSYIKEIISECLDGYTAFGDDVLIGRGVRIHDSATIAGPCVIGDNSELRPGAYIRGSAIICPSCVIGNSTEIKNSILLEGVAAPHYNYIGDSILGAHSHLGAGVICSNLKSDKSNVVIRYNGNTADTGLRKLGAIIGEGAEIGCGSVLNPGTVVGKNTTVYPLISLRGVYPSDSIVKSSNLTVSKI